MAYDLDAFLSKSSQITTIIQTAVAQAYILAQYHMWCLFWQYWMSYRFATLAHANLLTQVGSNSFLYQGASIWMLGSKSTCTVQRKPYQNGGLNRVLEKLWNIFVIAPKIYLANFDDFVNIKKHLNTLKFWGWQEISFTKVPSFPICIKSRQYYFVRIFWKV